MKPGIFFLLLLMFASTSFATNVKLEFLPSSQVTDGCDPNPGGCRILDQSWSLETWDCRNSTAGNYRCYADVRYDNGTELRVWGSCVDSVSDCWATGSSPVNPCN